MSVCLCELILTKTWKQTNECLFMWVNINKNLKTDEWVFVYVSVNINKNLKTDEWVFVYVS